MRRYPRRRLIRARHRVPSALIPLMLAAAGSIGLFYRLSEQLRPAIETLAVSKAVNMISLAISEETDNSLAEELLSYSDFIATEINPDGRITMLSFRSAKGARFKHAITERLVERMETLDPEVLAVPIGNLSGNVLFSALGPSIRVRIQSVGDIIASYENEFTAAGVNQTKHSVYLKMQVTVYLLIPGEIIPVTAEERVCVAETIIVGDVPDTYLNLEDGAN